MLRLEPPLIVTRAEIDQFAGHLDDLLSRGIGHMVADYLKARVRAGRTAGAR